MRAASAGHAMRGTTSSRPRASSAPRKQSAPQPIARRASQTPVERRKNSKPKIERVETKRTVQMATTEPKSKVELVLSAKNLANRDLLTKSDPLCVIYRVENGVKQEIARTETIKDNLSPRWATKVKVDFFFERQQTLFFSIYDVDAPDGELDEQDFLGSAQCDLAEVLASPYGYITLKVGGWAKARGHLTIYAEEVKNQVDDIFTFSFQGVGLPKRFLFCKPDSYLEFYKQLPDRSLHLVHRTTSIKDNCYPIYPDVQIKVRDLCGNEVTNQFTIQCHTKTEHEGRTSKLIGEVVTTFDELQARGGNTVPLINPKKTKNSGYTDSGQLRILRLNRDVGYSFIQYIKGGLQLEFGVCVDFTASNGQIHSVQSLHYLNGRTPNQYELAITSVLEICQHYNLSKEFDAMGFGAKVPPHFTVSHLFPLNVQTSERRVNGVEGVLHAYRTALNNTELYGPTNFQPSVREFAYKAQMMPKDGSHYQILLIITDGVITDMAKTLEAIVDGAEVPLSIIIVGVGNDKFEKMDDLDSDQTLLTAPSGRVAKRDIVQFVPFRNFLPPSGVFTDPAEAIQVKRRLAQEVLEEVPDQVTSYMRMHGIKPLPPIFTLPEGADIHTLIPSVEPTLLANSQDPSNYRPQPPYNPAY